MYDRRNPYRRPSALGRLLTETSIIQCVHSYGRRKKMVVFGGTYHKVGDPSPSPPKAVVVQLPLVVGVIVIAYNPLIWKIIDPFENCKLFP